MKKRLTNNGGLKLLSLAVAFIVWLLVINISNPRVRRSKSVEIEVLNDTAVTKNSRTYEIKGGNKVNIYYEVRALDEGKIKASDFRAYVDCNKLYEDTNSLYVEVEVVDNKDLIIGTPSASPGVINLNIEGIQQKTFDLVSHTQGSPQEGYSVGEIKLEPSSITLTGPENMFGNISNVGVEIDVDGASGNLSGVAGPVLYDANGSQLEADTSKLKFSTNNINYDITILEGKSVPLNFNVGGNVAQGYKFTGVDSATKSVQVAGTASALEKLSSVEIPQSVLNIEGATENKSVVININDYLPKGVSATGNSEIMITLKVSAINKKSLELKLSDIKLNGKSSAYAYTTIPENITLVVSGLESELNRLKASDINASINLSGLGVGTHSGSLTFRPSGSLAVDSYTPFSIVVMTKEEAQTSQTQTSADTESSSDSLRESPSPASSESSYQGESASSGGASRESSKSETTSKLETSFSQSMFQRETTQREGNSKPETSSKHESQSRSDSTSKQ